MIRPKLKKTPYELFYEKTPFIGYFRIFGCKCFILNTKDHHDKFDSKIDVGIFLGYAPRSKAYRVFNKRSLVVEESINVTFDETNVGSQVVLPRKDDDDDVEGGFDFLQINDTPSIEAQKDVDSSNAHEQVDLPKAWKFASNYPKEQIIGSPSQGVVTRSKALSECGNVAFLSQLEPKKINDALNDEFWVLAMHDELNNFRRNDV